MIGRLVSIATLSLSYLTAAIVSRSGRRVRPTRRTSIRSVLLTGRFDNPGWFRAHTEPLSRAGVASIVVVGDARLPATPPVRFECAPVWLRFLGPALSRFVWLLVTVVRVRPDLVVGFHLFPGALSALIAARLTGRPACYQMTGGEIEIVDGGVHAENAVMARLGRRSTLVERLALGVVREFDLIVVRGAKARAFLAAKGIDRPVVVNTAGIRTPLPSQDRPVDVVFVGRLTAIKQPEHFVEIVARVSEQVPHLHAVMVGDGPLLEQTRAAIAARGLVPRVEMVGQVENAQEFLRRAKIFVLTSRSEGLSIAAAEAMAAGAVPVMSDVGELRDLVTAGVSGFLVPAGDLVTFSERVTALLVDPALRERMSAEARTAALHLVGVDAVAARWRQDLVRVGELPRVAEHAERVWIG